MGAGTHMESPKRTPLYKIHMTLGAKMVPFGGYEMPVSYPSGIAAEHRAVRERVGVFDVSHMGEFEVSGPDRNAFVQQITCNDVGALRPGQAQYSAILTDQGTFVDDCLVYRFEDRVMLVVNAANITQDWDHIVAQKRGTNVRLRDISDETGLLAVQGPAAETLLAPLTPVGVAMIPYYHFAQGKVASVQCFISRTGYTGEDGFELYARAADTETLWHALVGAGRAEPCGLGARDTLRREAGYPLYGSDIDAGVTPYEAGLGWIVKLEKGAAFTGLAALKQQKLWREAPARGLQGGRAEGRRPARLRRVPRRPAGGRGAERHGDADRELRDRDDVPSGGRGQAGHPVHDRRARQAGAGGGGGAAVRAAENKEIGWGRLGEVSGGYAHRDTDGFRFGRSGTAGRYVRRRHRRVGGRARLRGGGAERGARRDRPHRGEGRALGGLG